MTARTFDNKAISETTEMTTQDHAALQFHSGLRFCSIRVRLIGFEPEMYETLTEKFVSLVEVNQITSLGG